MCGIAGILTFGRARSGGSGAKDRSLAVVKRMADSLIHRGPDDEGFWCDESERVFFGHRRLSIIDLTSGHQPMRDTSGRYCIVFNGEIYNYIELRDQLRRLGHVFATMSDTEVILEAYKAWGVDALRRLNGMFAIALWDSNKDEMLLARDVFGEKGLYYHIDGRRLTFGSEIKAITAAGIQAKFNDSVLADFLTFRSVPAPNTLFKDVHKLAAASYVIVGADGTILQKEYTHECYAKEIEHQGKSDSQLSQELLDLLSQSIRLRLRSDVEVGCMLSGGVDSSLVTALMATELRGKKTLHTFSIRVEDDSLDESPFQTMVSRRYDTIHHMKVIHEREFFSHLSDWFFVCDDLVADPSALALASLARVIRGNGIKVVLSGEGADELFAGYDVYRGKARRLRQQAAINAIVDVLPASKLTRRALSSLGAKAQAILRRQPDFYGTSAVFRQQEVQRMVKGEFENRADSYWRQVRDQGHDRCQLRNLLDFDVHFRLPDDILVRTDRATMSEAVESRVPFLDPSIHAWSRKLPASSLIRRNISKYIVKRASEQLLSADLLYRKKIGFDLPLERWMRGELRSFLERAIRYDRAVPCLDYEEVGRLYESWDRQTASKQATAKLWYICALEYHYRRWFE